MNTTTIHPSIDLSYLKMISNGDAGFEREMMSSLVTEIGEKMESLYKHLAASNANNSRVDAHSLKNLYSILGVALLSEQFKTIEHACTESSSVSAWLIQLHLQCNSQWQEVKCQVKAILAAA